MTDEELEAYDESCKVVEDKYDRLDMVRKLLNASHLDKTYVIKRSTNLGPNCPYYKKALRLFKEDQQKVILDKMRAVLAEFDNEEGI